MRLLRTLFFLRTIYFKQTATQILIGYGLLALLLAVLTLTPAPLSTTDAYVALAAFTVAAYFCLRSIIRTIIVNSFLRKHKESSVLMSSPDLSQASINTELDTIDRIKPIATFGDARLLLTIFDFYRQTKYGDYLAKQAYYLVVEMPLKRVLPHIVFDSKVAKRRQFRHTYLKVQQLSVQGPFDAVFDTYVPQTYAIDSLSFVSPEVMQVLMDARDYDIEIIKDRLFLYAPLIDETEMASLVSKAKTIARELDDNIDTYRDDRLKGRERETSVTPFARTLLKSPFKFIVWACLSLAATLGIIVAALLWPEEAGDILFNQFSVVIYSYMAINAWQAYKINRDNKRAMAGFMILYKTDRGRPVAPVEHARPLSNNFRR